MTNTAHTLNAANIANPQPGETIQGTCGQGCGLSFVVLRAGKLQVIPNRRTGRMSYQRIIQVRKPRGKKVFYANVSKHGVNVGIY